LDRPLSLLYPAVNPSLTAQHNASVWPFRRPNHNHNREALEAIGAGRSLAPAHRY